MKNNLTQQYESLSTQLNEWYQCMPFDALNEIHFEDIISTSSKENVSIDELLYDLRSEWHRLPFEEKIGWVETLYNKYQAFAPKGSFGKNVLSLYADEFNKISSWIDICEVVGANPLESSLDLEFKGVL